MKTTKAWAAARPFILFIFVSTIAFKVRAQALESFPVGTQSSVLTRTVEVFNQANENALVILQLKQGAQVDLLERWPGFYKIRFKIEGEFPVEGFVREGSLQKPQGVGQDLLVLTPEEQPYEAAEKTAPVTEVQSLATDNLKESPKPEIQARRPVKDEDLSVSVANPLRRSSGPWKFEGHGSLGLQTLSEKLTSKFEGTETYASEAFLSYEISGAQFGLSGKAGYEFQKDFDVGLHLDYGFTVFRGQVATETVAFNPNIKPSSVQALMHQIQAGPYGRYTWNLKGPYSITPELRVLGSYQIFTTNQLESKDNLSPGVDGQIVLFNLRMLQFLGQLAVKVTLPYDLALSPYLGANVYTSFSESPVTTLDGNGQPLPDNQAIRTGAANGADLAFSYGAEFEWNLRRFGLETINVLAFFHLRDISRKYSGEGNRAGMFMRDTKASSHLLSYGLGMDYLF